MCMKSKEWKKILKRDYGNIPTKEIALKYSVNPSTIYVQAQKHGIQSKPICNTQKISKLDAAYIAGFIDGEGHLQLISAGARMTQIQPQIQIANTDLKCLKWMQNTIGTGGITIIAKQKDGWKQCYRLNLTGLKSISYFLEQILPFLKIKKDSACLIKQFCDLRLKNYHRRNYYSKEMVDTYNKFKHLCGRK